VICEMSNSSGEASPRNATPPFSLRPVDATDAIEGSSKSKG
jgi:hypothetical protein